MMPLCGRGKGRGSGPQQWAWVGGHLGQTLQPCSLPSLSWSPYTPALCPHSFGDHDLRTLTHSVTQFLKLQSELVTAAHIAQ